MEKEIKELHTLNSMVSTSPIALQVKLDKLSINVKLKTQPFLCR